MPAPRRAKPVRQRRRPHQLRSARRVEEILGQTARLLEEVGPDRLTTNLVARRLGMSVGTLYHYFPNKHAVLYTLGVRWLDEWQRAFDEIEGLSYGVSSVREFVTLAVDRMLQVYEAQHGVLYLVQSMFTIPELRVLDTRQDETAVSRLTVLFRRLGIRAPVAERRRLARVYVKLTNSLLLEAVNQSAGAAQRTLADLKALLTFELTATRP